jgi:hypothetical protein
LIIPTVDKTPNIYENIAHNISFNSRGFEAISSISNSQAQLLPYLE